MLRHLFTKKKDEPAVMIGAVAVRNLGYTCMEDECENPAEYSDGMEYYVCRACKQRFEKMINE